MLGPMTPPALPYTGPRPKVALYATCTVDALYPRVGMAAVDLLESRGVEVIVPERQTCCARVGGQSRAASLLPLHHIALVPMGKLYGTVEAWIASLRRTHSLDDVLRAGSQVTLITGPSKSADIELTLTLGVHRRL